ncbi:C-terminal binding protein [Salinigranum salinum]|uniref:C-terminal binding protein n=1 Tax=Salinigranum salinum TaxID=1364937 RepID=UPI0012605A59|nr:C-terminal binding protein [Salinigranum salinum]
MSEYTVVVTDHDFTDLSIERDGLADVAEVVELTSDVGEETADAHDRLSEADAVINLRYDLDADAIAALDECRVVARYGIGVDNIAVDAATERGIPVTNVPDYCLEEVSIHALTLYLALARGLKSYDADVADGGWDRDVAAPIHRLSTRTVGVVGYGAIGRAVGERAAALGADVVASDPFLTADDVADDPAELVEFAALLEQSDVVTVHSPLTPETRELFDADAFSRMNEDAYFVNVARGPIVDGDALLAAVDDGEIAGAGLDVFPEEPPAADDPLRDHPKVITTPHVAWYSEEANDQRRETVTAIVRSALTGGDIENVVNDV